MVSFDILVQTVAQTAKAQLESTKKEKEKKKKQFTFCLRIN